MGRPAETIRKGARVELAASIVRGLQHRQSSANRIDANVGRDVAGLISRLHGLGLAADGEAADALVRLANTVREYRALLDDHQQLIESSRVMLEAYVTDAQLDDLDHRSKGWRPVEVSP